MAQPPVATVTFDPNTGKIKVEPEVIPVAKGTFILNWVRDPEKATWSFTDVIPESHKFCFNMKTINPQLMNLVDRNDDSSCEGKIKYTVKIVDEGGKEHSLDPDIENRPPG